MCCSNMNDQYSLLSRDWGSSYTLMCNNWGEYIRGGGEDNATSQSAFGIDSRIACICECHETLAPLPQSGYNYSHAKGKTSHHKDNNNNSNSNNNNNNNRRQKSISKWRLKKQVGVSDEEDYSRSNSTVDQTTLMKSREN